MPERIQRKRSAGWRMPVNTVYVGRGSLWGNPFVVGQPSGLFDGKDGRPLGLRDQVEVLVESVTRPMAVEFYRDMLSGFIRPEMYPFGQEWSNRVRRRFGGHPGEAARYHLRGKNLACWCALPTDPTEPDSCHAAVLLEIANA